MWAFRRILSFALIGGVAAFAAVVGQPAGVSAAPGDTVTVEFGFTGGEQSFDVPEGVESVDVVLCGAQGGSGDTGVADEDPHEPRLGGRTSATLPVTEGDTLVVMVGGEGGSFEFGTTVGAPGGFNGGGAGGDGGVTGGAGGGGASDVRTSSSLDDRLVVAGGAGGASQVHAGGAGGGTAGEAGSGVPGDPGEFSVGGTGGTQSAGGIGGDSLRHGTPGGDGAAGEGGAGAWSFSPGAGGGGGGWFGGGGGGLLAGGGGGSGFGPDGAVLETGHEACDGNGFVTISYVEPGPVVEVALVPASQAVAEGQPAMFEATVSNPGPVALTDVEVTIEGVCDESFEALAIDASVVVECMTGPLDFDLQTRALVTATGEDQSANATSETATVDVMTVGLSITKTPSTQTVVAGGDAIFEVTVVNTGESIVDEVTVDDSLVPDCDSELGTLDSDEVVTYECTATGVTDGFTNLASATGVARASSTDLEASAGGAVVEVVDPSLTVELSPSDPLVGEDGSTTVSVVTTNTGDVSIEDLSLEVSFNPVACAEDLGQLPPGQSVTVTCRVTGLAGGETITAAVAGVVAGTGSTVSSEAGVEVGAESPTVTTTTPPAVQPAASGPLPKTGSRGGLAAIGLLMLAAGIALAGLARGLDGPVGGRQLRS